MNLSDCLKEKRIYRWRDAKQDRVHVFEDADIKAVDVALMAERPLLLLGEPGTGKTQLAEAVASALRSHYVSWTVDARTEPGDLLYRIDHVARLARAQVSSLLINSSDTEEDRKVQVETLLALKDFLSPGPLWWALAYAQAEDLPRVETKQEPLPESESSWEEGDRVVALIDEIDKADPDIPNALLEVLGSDHFRGPFGKVERNVAIQQSPLVFITSNDERDLPDAFLRRCIVHVLEVDSDDSKAISFFMRRGEAHFPNLHKDVIGQAAQDLIDDRKAVGSGPLPGLAEYLDLLKVLNGSPASARETAQERKERHLLALEEIRVFTFKKFERIRQQGQGRRQ